MLLNMHIFKIYVSFDLNGDINDHFSFISQNFSFFLFFYFLLCLIGMHLGICGIFKLLSAR